MVNKVTIKSQTMDTNFVKETILDKIQVLTYWGVKKTSVVCTENKKGVNIKLSFDYLKKTFKVEKSGEDIDILLNQIINIATTQIEKSELKTKAKNHKYDTKNIEVEFDSEYLSKSILSLNNNIICHEESLKNIDLNFTNSNKAEKMQKLSFENACIQLELLGYDLYYFKDADTNKEKFVYKYEGNYITEEY